MDDFRLGAVSLDCADPASLAAFWAQLLGGEVAFSSDDFVAVKLSHLWLTAVRVESYVAPTWPDDLVPKQMHLEIAVRDLAASETVALGLGATRGSAQPGGDRWTVMMDPAGHPFCLTTQMPD